MVFHDVIGQCSYVGQDGQIGQIGLCGASNGCLGGFEFDGTASVEQIMDDASIAKMGFIIGRLF